MNGGPLSFFLFFENRCEKRFAGSEYCMGQIALQRAYGAIDQLDFLGERNIDGSSPERISIIADYGLHRIGFAEILGWFDALRCRKGKESGLA
jgi:hypothetical protein